MPNIRKDSNIKTIVLKNAIDFDIKKFYEIVEKRVQKGLFIMPGFKTSLKEEEYYTLYIEYSPDKLIEKINEKAQFNYNEKTLYKIIDNDKFCIAFDLDKGKLRRIITDLETESFRKLMFLGLRHLGSLSMQLRTSDYWLPEIQGREEAFYFLEKHITSLPPLSHSKENMIRPILFLIHHFTELHRNTAQEMNSGKLSKVQKIAYHKCKKNDFEGTLEEYCNPLSSKKTDYVAKNFCNSLKNIVGRGSKVEIALFVGCGEGKNIREFKKVYKNIECFAIEPEFRYISQIKKNTQSIPYIGTLQSFNPPDEIKFDYIFVINYNIISSQSDFFVKLSQLITENGTLIVGRAITDPEYISSGKLIQHMLKDHFKIFNIPNLETKYVNEKKIQIPDYSQPLLYYLASQPKRSQPKKTEEKDDSMESFIKKFIEKNKNQNDEVNKHNKNFMGKLRKKFFRRLSALDNKSALFSTQPLSQQTSTHQQKKSSITFNQQSGST